MLQKSPMYAYIPAKDVVRARQFYEKTLGLKAKEEFAGGVIYEFGKGTGCFLYPTPNAGTSRASQAFWEVSDVEVAVAELKARGVVFEEYDIARGADEEQYCRRRRRQNRLVQGHRGKYSGREPTSVNCDS